MACANDVLQTLKMGCVLSVVFEVYFELKYLVLEWWFAAVKHPSAGLLPAAPQEPVQEGFLPFPGRDPSWGKPDSLEVSATNGETPQQHEEGEGDVGPVFTGPTFPVPDAHSACGRAGNSLPPSLASPRIPSGSLENSPLLCCFFRSGIRRLLPLGLSHLMNGRSNHLHRLLPLGLSHLMNGRSAAV